jgi:DNA-binding PadR family transcriptional regulator
LKNDGLLNYRWEESTSGPPRKYYGLTEIGQTFLKELSGTWTELSDAVNLITNQNNSHEQNCKYKSRRNDFHIDEDAYQN